MSDAIICVCFGDGIGTEIMYSVLNIFRFSKVPIKIHTVEMGSRSYSHGFRFGIPGSVMDKIMEYKLLLTAPLAPPPENDRHFLKLDIPTYLECNKTTYSAIAKNDNNYSIFQFNLDKNNNSLNSIPQLLEMKAVANIGEKYAVFTTAHDHMPEIADTNTANPTSMILAATMLLKYIGLNNYADTIESALIKTLNNGWHCFNNKDYFLDATKLLGTDEFTNKIIEYL